MHKRQCFLFCLSLVLFFLPVMNVQAIDVGVVLDLSGSVDVYGTSTDQVYRGTVIPWFSTPLGSVGNLFFSLGGSTEYTNSTEKWAFVPELLRTDLKLTVSESADLTLGRMFYADPLGFIVNGLFDGARVSVDAGEGVIGLGLWYTWFLYKKTAHITMTGDDLGLYGSEPEHKYFWKKEFWNNYFAPRRVIVAVDWSHPGIAELVRLNLGFIGQFDRTNNSPIDTQYIMAKAALPFQDFVFELGGAVGLILAYENSGVSFAGELGISWMPPSKIHDRLKLTGRFSSGQLNDSIVAFIPVTTVPQGNILRVKLSGVSVISLDYTTRLREDFSLSLINSYYILSDKITYQGLPYGREGFFLGNEMYAQAVWSPASDFQIRAGGGVFMPSLGNAEPNGAVIWRIELSAVMAVF